MTDTQPDPALIEDPPTEDNRLLVTVDVASVPDYDDETKIGLVEVPGLGLFKNRQPQRVDEVQVIMFNQQGGTQIPDDVSEFAIKVPPDSVESDDSATETSDVVTGLTDEQVAALEADIPHSGSPDTTTTGSGN